MIQACAANGPPFATVGAAHEVSREEVIAFIKALELYLARDHDADIARWEAKIRHIQNDLADIPHVTFERKIGSETYIVPKLLIQVKPEAGFTGEEERRSHLCAHRLPQPEFVCSSSR